MYGCSLPLRRQRGIRRIGVQGEAVAKQDGHHGPPGRERAAALEDRGGEAAVDLGVASDDDGAGAEAQRLADRHARPQAGPPRLVRAGGDHAGADDDRPAAQARVALLLDGREEGVDVHVQQERRRAPGHPVAVHHPSSVTESTHHTRSAAWSWSW